MFCANQIHGIGIEVLDDTKIQRQHQFECLESRMIPQKLIVATSELVVNLGGPVARVSSLATIFESLPMVNMKDRLKPPSNFLQSTTVFVPGVKASAFSQSAGKLLNAACLILSGETIVMGTPKPVR